MRSALWPSIAVAVVFAPSTFGQTMYKCQEGGKVVYQGQPCASGAEKRIEADSGPTAEDAARAKARITAESDRLNGSGQGGTATATTPGESRGNQYATSQRVRELETILSSTTIDAERRRAAWDELDRIKRGTMRSLSADDQKRLDDLRVSLTSIDPKIRRAAEEEQRRILDKYQYSPASRPVSKERSAPQ